MTLFFFTEICGHLTFLVEHHISKHIKSCPLCNYNKLSASYRSESLWESKPTQLQEYLQNKTLNVQ